MALRAILAVQVGRTHGSTAGCTVTGQAVLTHKGGMRNLWRGNAPGPGSLPRSWLTLKGVGHLAWIFSDDGHVLHFRNVALIALRKGRVR